MDKNPQNPNTNQRQPTVIDAYGTQPHYRHYLTNAIAHIPGARLLDHPPTEPGPPVLIAGYVDARDIHPDRRVALIEHGAGQTYSDVDHMGYAGGTGWDRLSLVLAPGPHCARAWRNAYPSLPVVEFGTFHDTYVPRPLPPTIAFTFHWDCTQTIETRTAWPDWQRQIAEVVASERWPILGHWHPRWDRHHRKGPNLLAAWWSKIGVPHASVDDVFTKAGLLVADNTSLLYEFAATGRPVLCLNATAYRRDVEHGLRFWKHTPGHMLDPGDDLATGIGTAQSDWHVARWLRDQAVAETYALARGDQARRRCGDALVSWASIPAQTPA